MHDWLSGLLQAPQHCQSDLIRSIVCTDMGFIVSVSYDRAMYIYNEEHLHTPKKVLQASASRLTSVAWDKANNWLVTGSADGCVKVWSQEGRCLDQLVQCSDQVRLFLHHCAWPLSCPLRPQSCYVQPVQLLSVQDRLHGCKAQHGAQMDCVAVPVALPACLPASASCIKWGAVCSSASGCAGNVKHRTGCCSVLRPCNQELLGDGPARQHPCL